MSIVISDFDPLKKNHIEQLIIPHAPFLKIDESYIHTQFPWKIDLEMEPLEEEPESPDEDAEKAKEIRQYWTTLILLLDK